MNTATVRVGLKRLPHGEGLPLPAYQTPGAAGIDLLAALPRDTKIVLEPGGRYLVQTGMALDIPQNYEAQVRPRSGLARDHGDDVPEIDAHRAVAQAPRHRVDVLDERLGRRARAPAAGVFGIGTDGLLYHTAWS